MRIRRIALMSALAATAGGALWYKQSRTPVSEEEDTVIDLEPAPNGATPAHARQERSQPNPSRQDMKESELSL